MYSIEITSEIENWFNQPTVWDSLTRGVPFRQVAWLGSWWKHLHGGREPYLVIARDEQGTVQGLLPLYRAGSGTRGRTLRFIGDGNACTDDTSVLATNELAVSVAEAIGRHLVNVASDELDGMIEGDEACCALARSLRETGATLHSESRMNTWFKRCDGNWEEHLKNSSKSTRRSIGQLSKKMDSTPELSYASARPEDTENSLARLIEMHQARWNAAGEAGSYAEPEFRRFIETAVEAFKAKGQLYLPTLRENENVIAAELHFVGENGRSYCYSSGYDIEHSQIEPGRLLNFHVLQHAHASKWVGVDLMRGDEPYKGRMHAEPRKLIRLRAVAPAIVPRLYHAAWRTQFELTQWLRQRTGRKLVDVVEMASAK
jgi:CelD/BcsL family acetyltransferase involved in cellulose biosynthesis